MEVGSDQDTATLCRRTIDKRRWHLSSALVLRDSTIETVNDHGNVSSWQKCAAYCLPERRDLCHGPAQACALPTTGGANAEPSDFRRACPCCLRVWRVGPGGVDRGRVRHAAAAGGLLRTYPQVLVR